MLNENRFRVDHAQTLLNALMGLPVNPRHIHCVNVSAGQAWRGKEEAYAGQLGKVPHALVSARAHGQVLRGMAHGYNAGQWVTAQSEIQGAADVEDADNAVIDFLFAPQGEPLPMIKVRLADTFDRPFIFVPYIMRAIEDIYQLRVDGAACNIQLRLVSATSLELMETFTDRQIRLHAHDEGLGVTSNLSLYGLTPKIDGVDVYSERPLFERYDRRGIPLFATHLPGYRDAVVVSLRIIEMPQLQIRLRLTDGHNVDIPVFVQHFQEAIASRGKGE